MPGSGDGSERWNGEYGRTSAATMGRHGVADSRLSAFARIAWQSGRCCPGGCFGCCRPRADGRAVLPFGHGLLTAAAPRRQEIIVELTTRQSKLVAGGERGDGLLDLILQAVDQRGNFAAQSVDSRFVERVDDAVHVYTVTVHAVVAD
jgi:hypothetical protein